MLQPLQTWANMAGSGCDFSGAESLQSSLFDRGGGQSMLAVRLRLTEAPKQAGTGRGSFVMNN